MRDEATFDRGSDQRGAATSEAALSDVVDTRTEWEAWPTARTDARVVYWVMRSPQGAPIAIVTTELTDSGWFAVSRQDCA
jgi:hypothetical protein